MSIYIIEMVAHPKIYDLSLLHASMKTTGYCYGVTVWVGGLSQWTPGLQICMYITYNFLDNYSRFRKACLGCFFFSPTQSWFLKFIKVHARSPRNKSGKVKCHIGIEYPGTTTGWIGWGDDQTEPNSCPNVKCLDPQNLRHIIGDIVVLKEK